MLDCIFFLIHGPFSFFFFIECIINIRYILNTTKCAQRNWCLSYVNILCDTIMG